MNKRRYSNSNRVNLEVKPRSYNTGKYNDTFRYKKKDNEDMSKTDKLLIKTIISVIIVLGVLLMSNLNTDFSNGITQEISKAISYQVQWNSLFKSDIITNFEKKVASLIGGNEVQVFQDTSDEPFLEPVNGHLISEFEEKIHPVFNTKIEPRGIEYSVFEDQSVIVSDDGVVLNIMNSTYQGKRVVVQHQNQFKTVYDGVEKCDVKEGDSLKRGDEIGSITANEEISKLFFYEVWKDNVAVNPQDMFNIEQ